MKADQYFGMEAEDCIWIVTDLVISPQTEKYLVYSTHTGILHFIDLEKLNAGNLHTQKINLAALSPNQFHQGNDMQSQCVLMKKYGIFSLCQFPICESQVWCA
mmetsp:Transcript_19497/g.18623  ORF Transcript_19497/g.18623 Transcript_19497/m.18623 type:complete len:103 (+) Transcript_19497:346-654(+)